MTRFERRALAALIEAVSEIGAATKAFRDDRQKQLFSAIQGLITRSAENDEKENLTCP